MTTTWTADELTTIGGADEMEIAPRRADGSLRPYVTIWVVRVGDELYVRSYRGHDGRWFQSVRQRPDGRIRAGGTERDVALEQGHDADQAAIDDAYRTKYARHGQTYVDAMVSPTATATTLRLVPH